jgi:hypothetical protein
MAAMITICRIIFALFIVTIIPACPKISSIELCNNSGAPIVILGKNGKLRIWSTGERQKFTYDSDFVIWEKTENGSRPNLIVEVNGTVVTFHLNYVLPDEFLTDLRECLQMEADGKLYVVRPSSYCPETVGSQPDGFPLVPRKGQAGRRPGQTP